MGIICVDTDNPELFPGAQVSLVNGPVERTMTERKKSTRKSIRSHSAQTSGKERTLTASIRISPNQSPNSTFEEAKCQTDT